MTLDPRYAIVTASLTLGFGKATAAALAEAGMDVDVTWHSDSKGADAMPRRCDPTGATPWSSKLDYTVCPRWRDVTADLLIDDLGGLDVSINNAGRAIRRRCRHLVWAGGGRSSPPTWTDLSACGKRRSIGQGGQRRPVDRGHQRARVPATRCIGPLRRSASTHCGLVRPSRGVGQYRSPPTPALRATSTSPSLVRRTRSPSGGTAPVSHWPARNAREVAAVIAFLASPRACYATDVLGGRRRHAG